MSSSVESINPNGRNNQLQIYLNQDKTDWGVIYRKCGFSRDKESVLPLWMMATMVIYSPRETAYKNVRRDIERLPVTLSVKEIVLHNFNRLRLIIISRRPRCEAKGCNNMIGGPHRRFCKLHKPVRYWCVECRDYHWYHPDDPYAIELGYFEKKKKKKKKIYFYE